MFQTLLNVFAIKELRNKILFTLSMLLVFRIGHWIPLPGLNQERLAEMARSSTDSGSAFGQAAQFVAMMAGGTLTHSTIFGLGVMPYITAGIIFQLIASVSPQLKKLQEEGPTGRQKVMEWTRYATVGLAIIQGVGWLSFIRGQGLIYPEQAANPIWWLMSLSALTAGTIFLMWIGEQIDKHGIGNGVSMIIMAGILAGMPTAIIDVYQNFDPTDSTKMNWMSVIALAAGFVLIVGGSVIMTVAQRRIPVQQAKHTRGRRVFGGQRSYLPLRINHGGVMPIIFASSIMVFPSVLFSALAAQAQRANSTGVRGWWEASTLWLQNAFSHGAFPYIVMYIGMVYFFSYFWITVQFNPQEMAKQLREHGSFIPGLRPGPRTAEYLETVVNRVTYVGAAFLSLIAILPVVVNTALGIPFTVTNFLGGTGLLIVVSVCLDFLQRVEANLLMRNYAGFLSDGGELAGGPKARGGY